MFNIKEFLKDPEIQELLEADNIQAIYDRITLSNRCHFTEFLMNIGVDPFDYITNVVTAMYYELPITSIEIPDKVLSIGTNAFERCAHLETIKLPSNLYTIQACAFYCCERLKEVIIPDGTNSISNMAFQDCKNLKKVYIPDSISSISSSAFDGCNKLTIYCSKDNSVCRNFCFENNIKCELI